MAVIPCAFINLGNSFLSASSDHYCKVYDNQTFHDTSPLKNCTIPYDAEDEGWDSCSRYDINVSMGISPELCSQDSGTLECDNGWVYDRSVYENTVVHEYDLVCDKDWMKQLSKSIVPFGNLVGALLCGQLSDIIGRKPVFFISLISSIVVGAVATVSQTYIMFLICQFLLGLCSTGMFLVGFVIGVELVGTSYRTMCGIVIEIFFAIGYMFLAVIAAIANGHWRKIQFVGAVICLIYLPYYWLIPESARWLIEKKKYNKAEKILHKAATVNKVKLPDDMFDDERKGIMEKNEGAEIEYKEPQYTMAALFKTPNLRNRTINICYNWFAISFVYYGLSLNTAALGTNPYTAFLVSGAVEIPAYLLCWFLLDKVGRRWLLCSFNVLGGIALIISVPPENVNISAALAMVGKFFIAGSFALVYIFSAEIYPTSVRNAGMGLASTWARVGSISSPYVMLLIDVWYPLPYLIMAIVAILAGLLTLLLPETNGKDLPDTLEEGELFGTKHYKKDQPPQTTEVEIQCDMDEMELGSVTDNHLISTQKGVVNGSFKKD
uniref:Organic cation transporter protein-like n=1 Tax=Saccoglossus kowalevskii TaxID=10224 RepID=A0ABM0N0K1_SACKO|nr:PREDICTED: organic cation transporter protein-like [Saccoglossus kowalevskii]